jgi:hypothetical protein
VVAAGVLQAERTSTTSIKRYTSLFLDILTSPRLAFCGSQYNLPLDTVLTGELTPPTEPTLPYSTYMRYL